MSCDFPEKINRKIGRAMHDHSMLSDGDRVFVAVSGGVDSLVLAVVLKIWQKKAPIQYELFPVHIDHGFSEVVPGQSIAPQLDRFKLNLRIFPERPLSTKRSCFLCARNRRSQLFDLAGEERVNKIALGHHRDDLLETFMLNAFYGGNLSTMLPKQEIFAGELAIIRPLAYIDKDDIRKLASRWDLQPVANRCPFEENTRRDKVHRLLESFYLEEPGAKDSLFAALSNVRTEYLL